VSAYAGNAKTLPPNKSVKWLIRGHPLSAAPFPLAVIETGGRLFADGVRVGCSSCDGHLTEDTADAFVDHWPWLEPTPYKRQYLNVRHLRLKTCRRCRLQFIGHWRAAVCSSGCLQAERVDYLASKRSLRQERRAAIAARNSDHLARRAALVHRCSHCQAVIEPKRSTRRFCSDRCRKAASRAL